MKRGGEAGHYLHSISCEWIDTQLFALLRRPVLHCLLVETNTHEARRKRDCQISFTCPSRVFLSSSHQQSSCCRWSLLWRQDLLLRSLSGHTLVSSGSVIIGSTLLSTTLNGEWTFATLLMISDLSAKGSTLVLLSAKADKLSSISLMVKDKALVCTATSSRKSFKMQQFSYQLFQETRHFIEVFFSSSEIVFYCNNEKFSAAEWLPKEFADQVMISLGTFNDSKIMKKSYADIRTFLLSVETCW